MNVPPYCSTFSCKNKLNPKLEIEKQITNMEQIYYFCSAICRTKAFEDLSEKPYKKQ